MTSHSEMISEGRSEEKIWVGGMNVNLIPLYTCVTSYMDDPYLPQLEEKKYDVAITI